MKKWWTNILCIICVFVICFGYSSKVSAKTDYSGLINEGEEVTTEYSKLVKAVRKKLLNRSTSFTYIIPYTMYETYFKEGSDSFRVLDDACAMDYKNNSADGIYLSIAIKSQECNFQIKYRGSKQSGVVYLIYKIEYYTTKQEEAYITEQVNEILEELNLDNVSKLKKIRKIHNYVVNHFQYDQTYQNYDVYSMLKQKTGVCQAYSLLMYRLLTEAGIKCTYVSGYAGGNHAWNAVKYAGKWYFIDATWDDPVTSDGVGVLRYTYFMVAKDETTDHVMDENFADYSYYDWATQGL